jgi:hypothetical protein
MQSKDSAGKIKETYDAWRDERHAVPGRLRRHVNGKTIGANRSAPVPVRSTCAVPRNRLYLVV